MPRDRVQYVLRNTSILHLLPHPCGGGHEIHSFLSPYPTGATYQIWSRLAQ